MSDKPDGGFANEMSLRTWLAGQALQGILAGINQTEPANKELEDTLQDIVVKSSWALADAMLAERDKHAT